MCVCKEIARAGEAVFNPDGCSNDWSTVRSIASSSEVSGSWGRSRCCGSAKLPTGHPGDAIIYRRFNDDILQNHFAKNCSRNCPGNEPEEETSTPFRSPNPIWMWWYLQLVYTSMGSRVQLWWTRVAHGRLLVDRFVTFGIGKRWMCSLLAMTPLRDVGLDLFKLVCATGVLSMLRFWL